MSISAKPRVLIVDDDDGILQVSRMGLKRSKFRDQKLDILLANSGSDAVELLRGENGIGVMLIDGEMETKTAGLDTCKAIREELGNPDLRIYLRTGKVEMDAQEQEAAGLFDIEGHLPKGDAGKEELIATVMAGLEAYYAKTGG